MWIEKIILNLRVPRIRTVDLNTRQAKQFGNNFFGYRHTKAP